jgi:1-acyl-sn-glycerol-3-phosphate acyltransferase
MLVLGCILMLLPGLRRRRCLARSTARLLLRLALIPFSQMQAETIDIKSESFLDVTSSLNNPVIVVANHASYIDGIVLAAALSPYFSFVVKSELQKNFFKRLFLRRLGVLFVERSQSVRAAGSIDRMLTLLSHGESIAIFPEGTFRRPPGLLPFRMGAFVVAARSGVPVVPVIISGTRSILCRKDFILHRGAASVTICPPLSAHSSEWSAAISLRDRVRMEFIRYGESSD